MIKPSSSLLQQLHDGMTNALVARSLFAKDTVCCKVGNVKVVADISKVLPIPTMMYRYDPKYTSLVFENVQVK
jgi:hypothetical protein